MNNLLYLQSLVSVISMRTFGAITDAEALDI
jgi:hypothetical protein